MISHDTRLCDYCRRSIVVGQRWVREKIYVPRFTYQQSAYRHFHAEVIGGQEVSCWEKDWMEREIARTVVKGRNTPDEQVMRLVT